MQKKYNGLYLFLHPTDENDIDAGALFEYMRFTQEKVKKRFDWVFLNCGKTIYVCDYNNETIEPIVLPKNAKIFSDKLVKILIIWFLGINRKLEMSI